jgi:hypothetical protein
MSVSELLCSEEMGEGEQLEKGNGKPTRMLREQNRKR